MEMYAWTLLLIGLCVLARSAQKVKTILADISHPAYKLFQAFSLDQDTYHAFQRQLLSKCGVAEGLAGREFYVAFMEINAKTFPGNTNRKAKVFVTNPNQTQVAEVEISYLGVQSPTSLISSFSLAAGESKEVTLRKKIILSSGAKKYRACAIVNSSSPVLVQVSLQYKDNDDANKASMVGYNVLPVTSMTGDYLVATYCSWYNYCVFLVTSAEDDNKVMVHIRTHGGKAWYEDTERSDDDQFEETLNKGESLQVICDECDLTGTLISASQKVTVVAGGDVMWHYKGSSIDHYEAVADVMLPVQALGREYVLGSGHINLNEIVKVVVLKAGEYFTYDGVPQTTSTRDRQRYVMDARAMSHVVRVVSSSPLLVMEVMSSHSDFRPDESMVLALPIVQWSNVYQVYLPNGSTSLDPALSSKKHSLAASLISESGAFSFTTNIPALPTRSSSDTISMTLLEFSSGGALLTIQCQTGCPFSGFLVHSKQERSSVIPLMPAHLELEYTREETSSTEAATSTEEATTTETATSTEAASTTDANRSTEVATTTQAATSTEESATTAVTTTATTTEAATSTKAATTTEAPLTTEAPTSTEQATTTEAATSTKAATTTEALQTTEAPTSIEEATMTEAATSTKAATTTEAPQTTEAPTSTEEATTTEATTSTKGATTTEALQTTEAPTSTQEATTTEAPQTTEAPTSTEEATTTEAPRTTEAPTSTEEATTTKAATSTKAATTTETPQTTEAPTSTEEATTTKAATSTKAATTTEAPQTTEAPTSTEEATTTEAATSTKAATTTEAPQTTEAPTSTEEATTTETAATTEAGTTTEAAATTDAATTAERETTEEGTATEATATTDADKSTESATTTKTATSTEESATTEEATTTDAATSTKTATTTEVFLTPKAPTSTEESTMTEAATTTEADTSTESATTIQTATTIEAASTAEPETTTEVGTTNEAKATTEADTSTESATTIKTATTTEAATSNEAATTTEAAAHETATPATEFAGELLSYLTPDIFTQTTNQAYPRAPHPVSNQTTHVNNQTTNGYGSQTSNRYNQSTIDIDSQTTTDNGNQGTNQANPDETLYQSSTAASSAITMSEPGPHRSTPEPRYPTTARGKRNTFCVCRFYNKTLDQQITLDNSSRLKLKADIDNHLLVDRTSLSSHVRTKTSAANHQQSAVQAGAAIGVTLLATAFAVVVLPDLLSLLRHVVIRDRGKQAGRVANLDPEQEGKGEQQEVEK